MGITIENVTAKMGITRGKQDRFAPTSRGKARTATATGRSKGGIVPPIVPQGRGKSSKVFDAGKFPREISLKLLSRLKPAFLPPDDTVAAGNSSGRNDGASVLVLMDVRLVEEQGFKPLARILGMASAGINPRYMGLGPVPATQKTLEVVGLRPGDIQFIELNEASAIQSVGYIWELGLQNRMGIINVNDGTIAPERPTGSSGSRILMALVHEMNKHDLRYDLATLCIAGGMDMTTIVETVQ